MKPNDDLDRATEKERRFQELKAAIAEGIASLDRGEGVDGEAFFDELLADFDNEEVNDMNSSLTPDEREEKFQNLKAAIEHSVAQADRGELLSEEEVFDKYITVLESKIHK